MITSPLTPEERRVHDEWRRLHSGDRSAHRSRRPRLSLSQVVLAVLTALGIAGVVVAVQTPVVMLAAAWGLDHLPLLSLSGTLLFAAGCALRSMRKPNRR